VVLALTDVALHGLASHMKVSDGSMHISTANEIAKSMVEGCGAEQCGPTPVVDVGPGRGTGWSGIQIFDGS
jgi:hypothetical protein